MRHTPWDAERARADWDCGEDSFLHADRSGGVRRF